MVLQMLFRHQGEHQILSTHYILLDGSFLTLAILHFYRADIRRFFFTFLVMLLRPLDFLQFLYPDELWQRRLLRKNPMHLLHRREDGAARENGEDSNEAQLSSTSDMQALIAKDDAPQDGEGKILSPIAGADIGSSLPRLKEHLRFIPCEAFLREDERAAHDERVASGARTFAEHFTMHCDARLPLCEIELREPLRDQVHIVRIMLLKREEIRFIQLLYEFALDAIDRLKRGEHPEGKATANEENHNSEPRASDESPHTEESSNSQLAFTTPEATELQRLQYLLRFCLLRLWNTQHDFILREDQVLLLERRWNLLSEPDNE